MSGDVDYLLRVVVPDIAAYDAFYKRMIAKIEIRDVSSAFAMEQIKYSTQLPLDYMMLEKAKSQRGLRSNSFSGRRTDGTSSASPPSSHAGDVAVSRCHCFPPSFLCSSQESSHGASAP